MSTPSDLVGQEPEASNKQRIKIQTDAGTIELELFARQAPVTVKNFLRYVDSGCYEGGTFFRTVRMDNQPDSKIKIEVIQGSANPKHRKKFLDPIPLERTNKTKIKHLNGTISMARSQPDSARHHFFICIGDQPELDFGGRRNPDGQGFAAFGKVTQGMDIVKKIQAGESTHQQLKKPIPIKSIERIN